MCTQRVHLSGVFAMKQLNGWPMPFFRNRSELGIGVNNDRECGLLKQRQIVDGVTVKMAGGNMRQG